jgi:type I restriction enzyme, S subunit
MIKNFKFKDVVIEKKGFLRGPFGGDLKKEIFVKKSESTYKVYEQGVVLNSDKNIGRYYITEHDYLSKLHKFSVQNEDFLISCSGVNMGAIFQLIEPFERGIINQALLRVRLDKKVIDPNYFFYLFKELISKKITSGSGDSTIPNFPALEVIKNIQFDLPLLSVQKKIGKILYDLDAKIELNNKINTELAAMAKTLYDYWFVQFDFSDENGKPYKSSGGKMVWSEKLRREIPDGWEVKSLLDIATFTNGLACQKFRPQDYEDSYRVIKIREMGGGFTENSEFVSTNIPEKIVVNNGDILFSWSATLDVKIWTGGQGALNQHIFKVTSVKYPKTFYYFELLNYLQHFKMMAELRKTTMGHITQDHLRESRIALPPLSLIQKLDLIITPIFEKKVKLEEENQELASLRDWLLPMLMNGQVSIGETEEKSDAELSIVELTVDPNLARTETKTTKVRSEKSEAFLKKVMLGSHLIYSFYQEREFGHVKFMKLLYLCEQVGDMDLMTNYSKAAAGPFDKKTLASIETYIEANGWFKINKEPYTFNGKTLERTFYTLTSKSTEYRKYYDSYFECEKAKIQKLLQLLKGANSKKCEIVATTFYAWKELLKNNTLINDNSLVNAFFDFHPEKGKNFKSVDVKAELPWMRSNGVYPKN